MASSLRWNLRSTSGAALVTVDRLVNVLGHYGIRLRSYPIPRSTELRSVMMHEAVAR
jgi:uncharacterized membrane protein (DUF2068 family)